MIFKLPTLHDQMLKECRYIVRDLFFRLGVKNCQSYRQFPFLKKCRERKSVTGYHKMGLEKKYFRQIFALKLYMKTGQNVSENACSK